MKVQVFHKKDKDNNITGFEAVQKYYTMENGKFLLDENGKRKFTRKSYIVSNICIPNSIGNRGLYTEVEDVSRTITVQLKYKLSDTEWCFKEEQVNRKKEELEEKGLSLYEKEDNLYFLGNPEFYSCSVKVAPEKGKFYYGRVSKEGYFLIEKEAEYKPKRNDSIQA